MLAVYAPDCSLLQRTYIPGGQGFGGFNAMVATGPNSTVFVLDAAAPSFTPTDTGLFPAGQENEPMLLRLSPNPDAQTLPLACMGNAATYDNIAPIAPGEIVTLFGNGLGPQQGIQTQATLQTPFPTQEAGVEVTFDGKPAPLLWVQDEQINAVAPWSLTPDQNTEVCVSRNNVKTNCLTRPVGQTSMGVFLAKLNQDGTVNSAKNPAAPGSVVVVFATGMGPIAPAQADGALVGPPFPANVLPVFADAIYYPPYQPSQVIPLVVDYAGPAPFLLAGVSQINFHVPNVAAPTIFFRLGSSGSLEAATYVYLSPP
jgi:uncharacterized protein (TIGR03437 family)